MKGSFIQLTVNTHEKNHLWITNMKKNDDVDIDPPGGWGSGCQAPGQVGKRWPQVIDVMDDMDDMDGDGWWWVTFPGASGGFQCIRRSLGWHGYLDTYQDRCVGPTVKNLMVYAPEVSVYHAKIAQRSLAKVQGK